MLIETTERNTTKNTIGSPSRPPEKTQERTYWRPHKTQITNLDQKNHTKHTQPEAQKDNPTLHKKKNLETKTKQKTNIGTINKTPQTTQFEAQKDHQNKTRETTQLGTTDKKRVANIDHKQHHNKTHVKTHKKQK